MRHRTPLCICTLLVVVSASSALAQQVQRTEVTVDCIPTQPPVPTHALYSPRVRVTMDDWTCDPPSSCCQGLWDPSNTEIGFEWTDPNPGTNGQFIVTWGPNTDIVQRDGSTVYYLTDMSIYGCPTEASRLAWIEGVLAGYVDLKLVFWDNGGTEVTTPCAAEDFPDTYCGDEQVQTPNEQGVFEQCDEGDTGPGDGCGVSCKFERCGNGDLEPGEEWDTQVTNRVQSCARPHGPELSAWNHPTVWSKTQSENNCYDYAANGKTFGFRQPGGGRFPPYNCQQITQAVLIDGLAAVFSPNDCPPEAHPLALAVHPWDFHFYRRNDDGTWSHKVGDYPAKTTDADGLPMIDPQMANRGLYTDFCGYFCVPGCLPPAPPVPNEVADVPSEGVQGDPIPADAVGISILVYSGRRNPRWDISEASEIAQIKAMVDAGVPTAPPMWPDPLLGFSGFKLVRGSVFVDFPLSVRVLDNVMEVISTEGASPEYFIDIMNLEDFFLQEATGLGFGALVGSGTPGSVLPTMLVDKVASGQLHLSWYGNCVDEVTHYAVYEGQVGVWDSHEQLVCDAGLDLEEDISPSSGDRYYLVVPLISDTEGSYGRDSSLLERPAAASAACATTHLPASCEP